MKKIITVFLTLARLSTMSACSSHGALNMFGFGDEKSDCCCQCNSEHTRKYVPCLAKDLNGQCNVW